MTLGKSSPWEGGAAAGGPVCRQPSFGRGTDRTMSRPDDEELLNRALVAGLMLEVVLDSPRLPGPAGERRHHVKNRLKAVLVNRLAGHIPLDAFRTLTRRLDDWFEFYYPFLTSRDAAGGHPGEPAPAAAGDWLHEDLLNASLKGLEALLPKRRHRKLDRLGLVDFLLSTGGRWFRLQEFQEHFAIDRKTAWEYVQKFLKAGLLSHNRGRAAAVRYRLAAQFLKS